MGFVGAALVAVSACAVSDLEVPPGVSTPSLPPMKSARMEPVSFEDLPGWSSDNHPAALASLKQTCAAINRGEAPWVSALFAASNGERAWRNLCATAMNVGPRTAQSFFEQAFTPYRMGVGSTRKGKLTAYYTPRVRGARHKRGAYAAPLFRRPANMAPGDRRFTRKAIAAGSIPKSNALVWVDDPVEAFWMQIQGSGDVELANGKTVLMEVDGTNGQRWISPGSRGLSKQVLKTLYLHEPASAVASLNDFPRYVFYRPSSDGQVRGAAGVPLTSQRSAAVDTRYVPLGMPVYLSTGFGPGALNRLAMAQDVGGAIVGSVRADLYMGRGRSVERAAMAVNHDLDLFVLKARPNANFSALKQAAPKQAKPVVAANNNMTMASGGSNAHAVQLGAFSSMGNAQRAWQRMVANATPLLDSILPKLIPVGSLYRLRAGPLASRSAADGLCAKLRNVRIDCFPVTGL